MRFRSNFPVGNGIVVRRVERPVYRVGGGELSKKYELQMNVQRSRANLSG